LKSSEALGLPHGWHRTINARQLLGLRLKSMERLLPPLAPEEARLTLRAPWVDRSIITFLIEIAIY